VLDTNKSFLIPALVNKLVPCAWPSSGALEVWILRSRFSLCSR